MNEYYYQEKSATGWLIATYICAILGGLFGLVIGLYVYRATEIIIDPNTNQYRKVKKYKESHRTLGLVGAILAAVSIICWRIVLATS